jgi:rubrerythrin
MALKGSKTEQNLKDAFAGESQANRRYLYFAQRADVEGYNDVSTVFRSTAEGETGHAHGHLEYLEESGDPATGLPIGPTAANLKAAIAGETHEYTDMYPAWARTACKEVSRNCRLVRDAGEGRAFAREPLPESPGRNGLIRNRAGAIVPARNS